MGQGGPRGRTWLVAALLAAATIGAFSPLLHAGFLAFDDTWLVQNNPHVKQGLSFGGIAWAFSTLDTGFYNPLATLSHMLDWTLYGSWAGGHHLTSILIHAANALLLLALLGRMTGRLLPSALVAALFALHPLHVESVAWVSERKDLLAAFFLFLALLAYSRYASSPKRGWYAASMGLALAALLSKPSAVMAPALMLVLDVWPLLRAETFGLKEFWAKAGRLLLEKVPLFVAGLVITGLTVAAQHRLGAVSTLEELPLALRVGNALASLARYLWAAVWPAGLSISYPFEQDLPLGWVAAGTIFAAGVLLLVIRWPWKPASVTSGLAWYVLGLLPMLGLVQAGLQARADRYTYVPLVGLFWALAWGLAGLAGARAGLRRGLPVLALLWLALLGSLSWKRAHDWKDTEALFQSALRANPRDWVAHEKLGLEALSRGDLAAASEHIPRYHLLKPYGPPSYGHMGNLYLALHLPARAAVYYRQCIQMDPENPSGYYALAVSLADQGRVRETLEAIETGLHLARREGNVRLTKLLEDAKARLEAPQGTPSLPPPP